MREPRELDESSDDSLFNDFSGLGEALGVELVSGSIPYEKFLPEDYETGDSDDSADDFSSETEDAFSDDDASDLGPDEDEEDPEELSFGGGQMGGMAPRHGVGGRGSPAAREYGRHERSLAAFSANRPVYAKTLFRLRPLQELRTRDGRLRKRRALR
jgi:hypothetical protein